MRAIKSNTINTNSVPPLFVSGSGGNILIRGEDGYLMVRADITTVCDNQACQDALQEDCLGSYSHIQAGDIVIRTDLNKSFKYTLGADGKTLNPVELIADTVPHEHDLYHKTWISSTDPVLDKNNTVSAKDFWFEDTTGNLYFRYDDEYNGECQEFIDEFLPEGCALEEEFSDQWIRIQDDLHVDPTMFADNTYHVDTLADLDKLIGTKKGDLCVVNENHLVYKHSTKSPGITEWTELSSAPVTHIVHTIKEMLAINYHDVRQGDICVVEDKEITYKNLNGENSSIQDWQEIVSRGKSVTFFDSIDPALDPDEDVRLKDIWFNISTGLMYIRHPDIDDNTGEQREIWLALIAGVGLPATKVYEVGIRDEMYYLNAQQSDICIVRNISTTFIYNKENDDWIEFLSPNNLISEEIETSLFAQVVDPKITDTVRPYSLWFNTDTKDFSILDNIGTSADTNKWDWHSLNNSSSITKKKHP